MCEAKPSPGGGPAGCRQTTESLVTLEGPREGRVDRQRELILLSWETIMELSKRSGEVEDLFINAVRRWETECSPFDVTEEQLWSGRHIIEELLEGVCTQLGLEYVRVDAEQFHAGSSDACGTRRLEPVREWIEATNVFLDRLGEGDGPGFGGTTNHGKAMRYDHPLDDVSNLAVICRETGEVESLRSLIVATYVANVAQHISDTDLAEEASSWLCDRTWYIRQQEVMTLRRRLMYKGRGVQVPN